MLFKSQDSWQASNGKWKIIPWPGSRELERMFTNFSSHSQVRNIITDIGSSIIRMTSSEIVYQLTNTPEPDHGHT